MIFDLVCILTILGLFIKGLKEALTNKIAIFLSLIIALVVSSTLLPFYMRYINFPTFIPSNIFAFILTFIFSYTLMALPSLILSVVFGGGLLIIAYGVIVKFLPPSFQAQITQNSIIFPFIKPLINLIDQIYKWIDFVL